MVHCATLNAPYAGSVGKFNVFADLANQRTDASIARQDYVADSARQRSVRRNFLLGDRAIQRDLSIGTLNFQNSVANDQFAMGYHGETFTQSLRRLAVARDWMDRSGGARAALTANIHDGQQGIVMALSFANGPLGAIAGGVLAAYDVSENGVSLNTLLSVLPAAGMLRKASVLRAAETATARAARLGREGEAAAGIFGQKIGVKINGRMRFPDELSPNLLKEVKMSHAKAGLDN